MKLLLDYNISELSPILTDYNLPSYKIKQILEWANRGYDIAEMSNLSKELRAKLAEKFYAQGVTIHEKLVSDDGTEKYLYLLNDGNIIEGVFMKYKYGNTLCVSTQVGCRMGCTFCASTLGGLIRNLTAGEILGQLTAVNRLHGGTLAKREITNVVLMGSGEPLDNFDNVMKFLRLANDQDGLNISYRNISLSTCGIVPRMYELADSGMPVNLTVSLHAGDQTERASIMPIAKSYPLDEVVKAAKHYFEVTGRRVIYEYTLIDGVNDSYADALKLKSITSGYSAHINLIRLNPVKERTHRPTTSENANKFLATLTKLNLSATLRRQIGVDIDGACGQLRRTYLQTQEDTN